MAGFYENISNTTVQEAAEVDALASKNAAALSEANAATSEANAAISETNAATSATSASANVATNAASAAASEASRQAAVAAKTSAETAETNAETAEAAALVSKNASAVSATASEASKVTSVNSASTATAKAAEASTSETNAAASAATATTKAGDSETARAASVVAKDASVVAKNESVAAKDASVVAKNASVAAQAAAETAETNAETAETNSASSATASDNSATASANSATASESSKVTSVSSASAASTSETNAATSETNAAASYDLFDDRMLGAKSSAPTVDNDGASLVQGTLYFDTSSQTMKVYGSSGWVPAGSSVNGTSARFKFVATNSQTTFSGSDANSQTLGYDAGFLDVYLSGLRLVNGTDFTATTGTNIVLAAGAATGDILEVVAYGTFVLANFNADKLDGQHGSYYTGYTDTAVSNLVNSSPAALDTLQELATALGNDVNFSTTVTNSIATKAALAGATFTGEITANAGIDVTGTVTADGVLSAGSFNPSSSSWTTGSFRTSGSYGGGLSIIDSSAGWGIYAQNSGTTLRFGQGSTSGGLTEKMQINTSGIVVTGVVAAGDGSVTAPSVRGTDANTGLFFPSGGVTAITRNGVEGMRIDALGVTTFKGEVKISTAANKKLTFADDGGTFRAGMQAVTTGGQMISASAANDFAIRAQTNMLFATGGNTERMRILSDGAACFGTTTSRPAEFSHPDGFAIRFDTKGQFQNTVTNAPCGIINRDGTDGDILVFRKDGSGTPVGSIGTIVGQPYFTSQSRGIRIAGNNIRPTATAGANLDNVITLGASGQRFKDLYLSGGVYLGGTGAANKLDDYEEGTWTPTVVQGSVSTSSANYTKTGRTVVLSCVLSNFTNDTSTSAVTIAGLPFASKAASVAVGSMLIRGTNRSGILTISPFISSSSSQMTFYLSHENSTVYSPLQHDHFTSTTADIIAEITYITT